MSAFALLAMHPPEHDRGTGRAGFVAELAEGWSEFRARTWVWVIVLQYAGPAYAALGPFMVLGVVIARDSSARAWCSARRSARRRPVSWSGRSATGASSRPWPASGPWRRPSSSRLVPETLKRHDETRRRRDGRPDGRRPPTSRRSLNARIASPHPEPPRNSPTVTTHPASIPLVSTIFGLTYLALAVGKVPGLRIDRAGIALVGAAAMLGCGVLDAARRGQGRRLRDDRPAVRHDGRGRLPPACPASSPWRPSGSPPGSPGPLPLLAVTIGLSGVLSAFLVNDVVCVALTPLVLAPLPAAEAAADPVPGRPGDGLERRLGGHDHRQPAEHHHRLALAHLLPPVRREAGPGGR